MAPVPTKLIFGRPLQIHSKWTLFEGTYKPTGQPVLLKQCLCPKLPQLTSSLKEIFRLAKLNHACLFNVIDMIITEKEAGLELVICVERLEKDLQREIVEKAGKKQRYRERELWGVLRDLVQALAYAQKEVVAI